jgi:hypothetical protein
MNQDKTKAGQRDLRAPTTASQEKMEPAIRIYKKGLRLH